MNSARSGWSAHVALLMLLSASGVAATWVHGKDAWEGVVWGCERLGWYQRVCLPFTKTGKGPLTVNFGVYDPDSRFLQEQTLALEHFFLRWDQYRPGDLTPLLRSAQGRRRWPLLTIEPWPDATVTPVASTLLQDVEAGRYDRTLQEICTEINAFRSPVFLRWGHEMEHLNGRYPWATNDAEAYQRAYRHVVTAGRRYVDNVFYIWSPAGDRGLERYWPGREYVDYVGLSLYALRGPDDNSLHPFDSIFAEKYGRVEGYARPIVIAELGVRGSPGDQRKWMQAAFEAMPKYRLLKSAVYFNAKDTAGAWDLRYGTPDWHIDPEVFRRK